MDFMQDCLADGRRIRVLSIVDDFTRKCAAIEVDTSVPGVRVVRVLERLALTHGLPRVIVSDNGSEFTGKALDAWANRRGIKLHFIDPGRPMQNAYVDSFNGKYRDECLDQNWFTDLPDAKAKIESWRHTYYTVCPHSSLNDATPAEFAGRFQVPRSGENPLAQLLEKRGAGQTYGLTLAATAQICNSCWGCCWGQPFRDRRRSVIRRTQHIDI